jgi:hypothetical protein
MLSDKFDPYGEASPTTIREIRGPARRESASMALDRAGQFAFWILVAVIVSARVIWYPAGPGLATERTSEPQHVVMR